MKRRNHGVETKVRIVLEALKRQKTVNEIAGTYGVHPNQVGVWKKRAVEILTEGFSRHRERATTEESELIAKSGSSRSSSIGLKKVWPCPLNSSGNGWSLASGR